MSTLFVSRHSHSRKVDVIFTCCALIVPNVAFILCCVCWPSSGTSSSLSASKLCSMKLYIRKIEITVAITTTVCRRFSAISIYLFIRGKTPDDGVGKPQDFFTQIYQHESIPSHKSDVFSFPRHLLLYKIEIVAHEIVNLKSCNGRCTFVRQFRFAIGWTTTFFLLCPPPSRHTLPHQRKNTREKSNLRLILLFAFIRKKNVRCPLMEMKTQIN